MELMNKCKCGGTFYINVGDSNVDGKFRWYISYHCNNCKIDTEMDGDGIDTIPDDIKELIVKREGRWGLCSSSSGLKIKYLLRKMLKNYDSLISPKDIFYCGTQNQVKWVKNKLMEKGIDKDSLIIKNIDDKKSSL